MWRYPDPELEEHSRAAWNRRWLGVTNATMVAMYLAFVAAAEIAAQQGAAVSGTHAGAWIAKVCGARLLLPC